MKTDPDLERRLRALLRQTLDAELGPDPTWTDAPAARRVAEDDRRKHRARWPLRILGVAALIGAGGGAALLADRPEEFPVVNVDPTPTATPSVPGEWSVVTSSQYGFDIGHPPSWSHVPATRAWEVDSDTSTFMSAGEERFMAPGGNLAVSAWSFDAGVTFGSTDELVAWIRDYCAAVGNEPCGGVWGRAIPLCIGGAECRPGLLVPYDLDAYAFLPALVDDRMVVVAVWRPDDHPSVEPYGGSVQLLLDFVATMDVCPEAAPSRCDGAP